MNIYAQAAGRAYRRLIVEQVRKRVTSGSIVPFVLVVFLPARRYASAGLCEATCLSVCLSVRLSHTGIVPSRAKSGS